MELVALAEVELTYTSLEVLDYGAGGQIYGTMEGRLSGGRLTGDVRLTNLAARRADDVNVPTLRGVVTTEDGAALWIELDGLATLRESDRARVFVTACRLRTGDERYAWANSVVAVLEGVLDAIEVGGKARARLYECRATIE